MQPRKDIRKIIDKTPKDTGGDNIADAQEAQRRKRYGVVVAVLVFLVAYAIFVFNFDHLGLALGWLPSGMIAAAFGWIVYCFPWIGDAIALLLDLAALLG